ncbi:MAG TPA: adenylate/guanylate cyclase domain-containing protein [Acidimicrobiia bacterium]|jgi:class 3 adenylate cyclase/tetratricopeptide (TPR) repeat protein
MGAGIHTLQPYLPRLVRYWDQDARGQLHRAIAGSMVFVDVSGFTKMSERLARFGKVGAEEVTDVIDDTFGRLLSEAYAFGANLIKFGGDALLLLFTGENHALRACAGAWNMRRALREIAAFRTTAGQVSLRMSVGVHSGVFDFFLVGESHRELIVTGPAATMTVEMETAASAGQILVSPAIAEALPRRNRGRAIGPGVLLKGSLEGIDRVDFRATTTPGVDLAPFIPLALCEPLLSGAVEAGHRPAAVAFLAFHGFDRLLETLGGRAVAYLLDDLIRTVQQAVDPRGVSFLGTDVAPDGGKIILASGVPTASGQDEEQMLLALRAAVNARPAFPLHVGATWGHIFAGEVGPAYRRTYTVMGDTVNLAARLAARAQVGQILATEALLAGSRTTFTATALEPFLVKGKKGPVTAFSLEEAHGSRSQLVDVSLPLLGRDSELAAMVSAWNEAQSGIGSAIEITAEPGMGKSRLLQEFVGQVDPGSVVSTECRLYQAATPYFPLKSLLARIFGLEGMSPEEAISALRDLVLAKAPDQIPWLALIGTPLDLHIDESSEVQQLDEEFRRPRTQEAVARLAAAVVTEPVVFIIEDTHWMDEASGDLLLAMMSHWGDSPGLLCLTRRPGNDGFSLPEGARGLRIDLKPLSREDAEQLIIAASEGTPLMPNQVALLARRAEGSPLFLIELLQALRQGGDVEALPHSVEGLIGARIDKLPSADRNLLRRVAVLGAGFKFEHAAAVLHEPELGVSWQARALRRLQDFLSIDETGWVQFRHALIRDVAYGSLPFRVRQALHARVGDSIRQSAGDLANTQAELLSLHYSEAKRWPEAWDYSRVAGDNAKQIYANLEAATFYRRALVAARHVAGAANELQSEVAESLGDVLEQAGLFQGSIDAYKRAIQFEGENAIRCADLRLKRARARARIGGYRAAFRDIGTGQKLVAADPSTGARKAVARLTALSAQLRQLQELPRSAVVLAEKAMAEAREADEQEALARSYQVLDAAYSMLGQPSKAVFGQEALAIYERLGDLPGVAIVTNNLGGQAYFAGTWDIALSYYAQAQDAFRRAGNEPEAATAGANIGEVLVSQGKLAEAEPMLTESVRVLRAHNLIDAAIFAELQLARLQLLRGREETAMSMLTEIGAEAAAVGQTHSVVEAAIYRAQGLVTQGQPDTALEVLGDAVRNGSGEADVYGCALARVEATALAALGRIDEAAKSIEAGLKQARAEGLVYDEALLLRADAQLIETDPVLRQNKLEEADRLFQLLGVVQAA